MNTADIIKELCKENDMTLARLERELNFGNGTIVKSSSKMSSDRLKAVADYFGVAMEYLMTGEDPAPAAASHRISDFEYEIILAYRKHTEAQGSVLKLLDLDQPEAAQRGGIA